MFLPRQTCKAHFGQGTPHRGSRVASWATVMSNFINTCPFYTPVRKQLLSDLSLSSTVLAEISTSFRGLASNIEIKSFYETSRMPPLKGLVSVYIRVSCSSKSLCADCIRPGCRKRLCHPRVFHGAMHPDIRKP